MKIIDICLNVIEMRQDEIGLDDPFKNFSHIDSLKAMDLLTDIERGFKIKIPEREVRQFETINKVIGTVERYLPAAVAQAQPER